MHESRLIWLLWLIFKIELNYVYICITALTLTLVDAAVQHKASAFTRTYPPSFSIGVPRYCWVPLISMHHSYFLGIHTFSNSSILYWTVPWLLDALHKCVAHLSKCIMSIKHAGSCYSDKLNFVLHQQEQHEQTCLRVIDTSQTAGSGK